MKMITLDLRDTKIKEELIKALKYDRGQYSKGYTDGVNEFAEKVKELTISKDFYPVFFKNILNEAKKEMGARNKVRVTHYDRIRNMSVDEMAAFCARNFGCKNCEARELCRKINSGDCILNCFDNVKQWLESEVE